MCRYERRDSDIYSERDTQRERERKRELMSHNPEAAEECEIGKGLRLMVRLIVRGVCVVYWSFAEVILHYGEFG